MPNHDMSDTACQERAQRSAEHEAEHDEMLQRIIVLETKLEKTAEAMQCLNRMCSLNRDSIMTLSSILQEHTKCLKQDS